ncbi:hypothetical protein HN283_13700 [Acinetobacter baumannii]|uniref:hypothetical protein n=1 Tax=Acinetobacter baumannii TaxID=470 RepID=UPI00189B0A07|nr:hypothetical protein [Acinetobacter baumannii]MBF6813577.1 hypothetical protein [Acinetobacter baumannii]MBF6914129.1 hypothetical protein [Acinetobacter baumannii]MBF6974614.1 hypothetical protein [Acinetobacter baumannii]
MDATYKKRRLLAKVQKLVEKPETVNEHDIVAILMDLSEAFSHSMQEPVKLWPIVGSLNLKPPVGELCHPMPFEPSEEVIQAYFHGKITLQSVSHQQASIERFKEDYRKMILTQLAVDEVKKTGK